MIAIEQLKAEYALVWVNKPELPDFTIVELYNLWYYATQGDIRVCRGYYKFTPPNPWDNVEYWNSIFYYNTTTGLWRYLFSTGNAATATNNGLPTNDGNSYQLIYTKR